MSAFRRLADATRSFFRADGSHATDAASQRFLLHSGTRLETLTQVGGYRRNAWVVIAEIRRQKDQFMVHVDKTFQCYVKDGHLVFRWFFAYHALNYLQVSSCKISIFCK